MDFHYFCIFGITIILVNLYKGYHLYVDSESSLLFLSHPVLLNSVQGWPLIGRLTHHGSQLLSSFLPPCPLQDYPFPCQFRGWVLKKRSGLTLHSWQPLINSLWPSNAILKIWSIMVNGMAWCRQTTSHYVNQCWLVISEVLGHYMKVSHNGGRSEVGIYTFIILAYLVL